MISFFVSVGVFSMVIFAPSIEQKITKKEDIYEHLEKLKIYETKYECEYKER